MRFTDDPLEPFGRVLLDLVVETNLGLKTPLVFRVLQTLRAAGCLPAYGCHLVEVALEEAIANAMIHGNGLDPLKNLHIQVFADEQRFGVIVEDQGRGFSPAQVPNPDDPDTLLMEHGRGILLIDHYVDSLEYNRRGTRLRMIRRRQTEPDPGSRPPVVLPEVAVAAAELTLDIAAVEDAAATRCGRPAPAERVQLPDDLELAPAGAGTAATAAPLPPAAPTVSAPTPAAPVPDAAAPPPESLGPVTVQARGPITVVVVRAERISEDNAAELRNALNQVAARSARVVLDLGQVEFTSSVGIGTVMMLYKALAQKKGRLILCDLQPAVQSVMKAAGLLKVLPVADNLEQAIAKA